MERVETITPYEAGRIIGKNADFIRFGLRAKRFDFGSAVQGKTGRWNYHIVTRSFRDYTHMTKEEFETKLKEIRKEK